jgi:superfamily II DNA or RNA helicase
MPAPFFDSFAREFAPDALTSGLSIYHAGGVRKFEHFGELTQADIRAGLGEYFRVHAKFHTDGRAIQWMDCSCRDNRRRGTKCAHLAALCIHIDENQSQLLRRFGLSGGKAEERIMSLSEDLSRDSIKNLIALDNSSPAISSQTAAGSLTQKNHSVLDQLPNPGSPIDGHTLQLASGVAIKGLAHAKEPGVLIATVARSDGRELRYRLGVDDSLSLLEWPPAIAVLSTKLSDECAAGYSAHRLFSITRPRSGQFQIEKKVLVTKSRIANVPNNLIVPEGQDHFVSWEEIPKLQISSRGLFIKGFGFLRFGDGMDSARTNKWSDYPSIAKIDSEVAADLFNTDFERLRQTAQVMVDPKLQSLRVTSGVTLGPIEVSQHSSGQFLVKTVLVAAEELHNEAESTSKNLVATKDVGVTLIDILSARKAGRSYIETPEGWVKVSQEFDWIAQRIDGKGRLQLSKLEFIRFRESLAHEHEIKAQGDVVQRLCAGLISQRDIINQDLPSTALRLRPYQRDGFQWLWWLYENRLGGLLADEMGLGKTHQAMALLGAIGEREPGAPPSLVVCPTTVMDHWKDKLSEFLPGIRLFCYYGATRPQIPQDDGHFLVLTSYGILLRDIDALAGRDWSAVILDEAHLVKNQTTRTYQAACKLRCRLRVCLTGTPLENDLFELKTLFDFIVPGYLGPDTAFRKRYISSNPLQPVDPLAAHELKRLIHPFKLRRIKSEVLTDLPEKVEEKRICTLHPRQRELYEQALKLRGQPLLDALTATEGPVPYVHVFAVITFLKQICNDPGLVHPDYEGITSGKMEMLDEILSEALESDHKVVIFSQYARMVGRLSKHLDKKGVKHVCITGQSTNRGATIAAFQTDPDVRVFIGSLLAGGTGIDLTAGSVVIHFDRWWNAAKENQATDRIHRIGQQKNVQVFKLITRGTVEEHIDKIIAQKKLTFEQYVEEDPQAFRNISRDDLLRLFASPPPAPTDGEIPVSEEGDGIQKSSNDQTKTLQSQAAVYTPLADELDFLTFDHSMDPDP